MKIKLTEKNIKIASAGVMVLAGFLAAGIGKAYHYSIPAVLESVAETTAAVLKEKTTEFKAETKKETEAETEAVYIPNPQLLNLAHYYPDGSDAGDVLNSYAGRAYKELSIMDSNWYDAIFDLSDTAPEVMASRMGLPVSSVMGSYNKKDEKQHADDPSSWKISSYKNVSISMYNADGNMVSGASDVKEILSMASVYTYYSGMEDYDTFLNYAKKLWNASHRYTVSMSHVYYCDGCMDKTDEELIQEEEAQTSNPVTEQEQNMLGQLDEGSDGMETVETTAAESTLPDLVVGPARDVLAAAASASDASMEANSSMTEASTAETTAASAELDTEASQHPNCPGHIDLVIKVHVVGLDDQKGLFTLDSIGNSEKNMVEGGWSGWNPETKSYAINLSHQDWFAQYGLSISAISTRIPLSAAETQNYVAQLPDNVSETRKAIIQYALESVGKVPYYWGGKASRSGYDGNSFGTYMEPDTKGRVLKGLDCSGWIAWVYWSVTGDRLPAESTSGLRACGRAISRSELQPGDIIVRTGENSHVIMFLGWTPDGKIKCIHETAGAAINNVTIGELEANWPYYRRLIN